MQADVDTHEPSVKSVNRSGASLSDPQLASAVHEKLRDLNVRYETVAQRCRDRGDDIKSVSRKLKDFNESAVTLQQWITPVLETLESKEMAHLDTLQVQHNWFVSCSHQSEWSSSHSLSKAHLCWQIHTKRFPCVSAHVSFTKPKFVFCEQVGGGHAQFSSATH